MEDKFGRVMFFGAMAVLFGILIVVGVDLFSSENETPSQSENNASAAEPEAPTYSDENIEVWKGSHLSAAELADKINEGYKFCGSYSATGSKFNSDNVILQKPDSVLEVCQ